MGFAQTPLRTHKVCVRDCAHTRCAFEIAHTQGVRSTHTRHHPTVTAMSSAATSSLKTQSVVPRIERPSISLLGLEPTPAALEFGSHAIARSPRGVKADGHPVIIFPGMATGRISVSPLRRYCENSGYAASYGGLGLERGPAGRNRSMAG